MNNAKFVSSTLHTVASGIDISKDLASEQQSTISSLLKGDYEEKEKNSEKPDK